MSRINLGPATGWEMRLFNGLNVDEVVARQTELFQRLRFAKVPDARENDG
jgi:hypothetical protein